MQKNYSAALDDFDKALSLPKAERLPVAAYYKGLVYADQEDSAKAISTFEAVIKDNKNFRPAYLRLFELKFQEGKDYDKSLEYLTDYINRGRSDKLPKGNWEVYHLRGRMLRPLVGTASGGKILLKEFEKAERGGGKSAQLYFDLAGVHFLQERPEEALDYLDKAWNVAAAEDLDAKAQKELQVNILNLRGWAYTKIKTRDDAKANAAFIEVLLKFDNQNAEAYSGIGFLRRQRQSCRGAFSRQHRDDLQRRP